MPGSLLNTTFVFSIYSMETEGTPFNKDYNDAGVRHSLMMLNFQDKHRPN